MPTILRNRNVRRPLVAATAVAAAATATTVAVAQQATEEPQRVVAASGSQVRPVLPLLSETSPEDRTATPEPEPEPAPTAQAPTETAAPEPSAPAAGSVWDALAGCEASGDWQSSAGTFEGGLQFHPQTWDAYKPAGYPEAAYQASRSQQIAVAEQVLADQGWGAWPACSAELGLR